MKSLGYTLPYVLITVMTIAKKKPTSAFHMLRGYLSNYDKLYEKELRDYVKKNQYYKLRHLKFEHLRLFFKRFRDM